VVTPLPIFDSKMRMLCLYQTLPEYCYGSGGKPLDRSKKPATHIMIGPKQGGRSGNLTLLYPNACETFYIGHNRGTVENFC